MKLSCSWWASRVSTVMLGSHRLPIPRAQRDQESERGASVCSVKKLIGNLMCFSKACPVGLGYFGRASRNITTYMYIFSGGLSSFPRNVFSNVLLGGQMWRTKQTSSVLKINQRNGVSLHSGFCSAPPDASSGLKIYSLRSRNAAVSQPSAVRPL